MSKLLDPAFSGRVVGGLMVFLGIVGLLVLVSFSGIETVGPGSTVISFGLAIGMIVVGVGLWRTKLWAVYGGLAWASLSIVTTGYNIYAGLDDNSAIVRILFVSIIAVWFYNRREAFS